MIQTQAWVDAELQEVVAMAAQPDFTVWWRNEFTGGTEHKCLLIRWIIIKKSHTLFCSRTHLQNQIEVSMIVFPAGCFIQCKLTQSLLSHEPWCGYVLCGREEKVNPGQAYINYPSLHTIFLLSFWNARALCPTLDAVSYSSVSGSTQTPGATLTLPQGCCCCCCWQTHNLRQSWHGREVNSVSQQTQTSVDFII